MSGGSMGAAPQQSQGVAPQGAPTGSMPVASSINSFPAPYQQSMAQQAMPQQINPYQQMMGQYGQPQQQINPYQQMQMRAPMQQQMQMSPQQQQMSGLQSMFNRMMGGYTAPQQRGAMPRYQSQALSYRPDMTQAIAALSRTANSPVAATQTDVQRTAQDEADFQTYLRDQYIKSKQTAYE